MKKDEFGFVTKKENKGIKNICIFAGATAILGSVIGTCIYKAHNDEDRSIITENEEMSIVLRSHSIRTIFEEKTFDINGEKQYVTFEKAITSDKVVSIPKSDKEVIAIEPVTRISFEDGIGIPEQDFLPIYNEEDICTTGSVYMKTDLTNKNGLLVYENNNVTKIYDFSRISTDKTITDENITPSNEDVTYETKKVIKSYKIIPIYETVIVPVDEHMTPSSEEVSYETKKVIKSYKKVPIYETVTIAVPVDESTIEAKTYSKTR